jgi:hypothetical protein
LSFCASGGDKSDGHADNPDKAKLAKQTQMNLAPANRLPEKMCL